MALNDFTDLKSSVATWLARSDMAGMAEDFITLTEARLNRELNPVEATATITATPGSRTIDVTAQSVEEPAQLFISDPVLGDESELQKRGDGTFPYVTDAGRPWVWSYNSNTISFERPADQAYSLRFLFTQRFKLSDAAPTNWLLTNHPDIYLAAVLIWGGVLKRDSDHAAMFIPVLSEGLPSVKRQLAQSKRGQLRSDPALTSIGRGNYWEMT